jgi:hypothetical protein
MICPYKKTREYYKTIADPNAKEYIGMTVECNCAEHEFFIEKWGNCEMDCPFMNLRGPMENPTSYCDRVWRDSGRG